MLITTGSTMTPELAATHLDAYLRKYSWYVSVGVGQLDNKEALFVYVKSNKHRELKAIADGWMGYKTLVRPTGAIKNATTKPSGRVSCNP